jgi:purine-nucleoside phosphorylase
MIETESVVDYLRSRTSSSPRLALILGSGLGGIVEEIDEPVRIPYEEIPGFPVSTVAGHAGSFFFGRLGGVDVVVMSGRFHLYEGWRPEDVRLPVATMAGLGATHLIVTNAAGGIRAGSRSGDLMLITDHIDLMTDGAVERYLRTEGRENVAAADCYSVEYEELTTSVAADLRITLHRGVYAGMLGPSFETPAEIRMLADIGADAVGMSTIPEVLSARELGMRVLAISCITNPAAGIAQEKLTHAEVLAAGAEASERLGKLLLGIISRTAVEADR